jgi:YgiT-type zinc finger domain-containing protein
MKFENCSCRNTKPAKVTKEIRVAGTTVLVQDAPVNICQTCGEIYFDGKYIMELSKKIKKSEIQPA